MTVIRSAEEQRNLVESTMRMLLHVVQRDKISVSADMRVSERDAAKMAGYAHGSFKNLRNEGKGPTYYNRAVAGCRVSYRLMDLAAWLEERRENN
jgi:hypothetical protein